MSAPPAGLDDWLLNDYAGLSRHSRWEIEQRERETEEDYYRQFPEEDSCENRPQKKQA